jgi:hypothetical protein
LVVIFISFERDIHFADSKFALTPFLLPRDPEATQIKQKRPTMVSFYGAALVTGKSAVNEELIS